MHMMLLHTTYLPPLKLLEHLFLLSPTISKAPIQLLPSKLLSCKALQSLVIPHCHLAFRDPMVLDHSIAQSRPEIALFPGYRSKVVYLLQSPRQRLARCGYWVIISNQIGERTSAADLQV